MIEELREAAKALYNMTIGDSEVIVRAPSAEKRDAITAAGERLRVAIAAPVIPAGFQLVPIEPTEDMVVNGFESWPDRYFSKPEDWLAFEAMTGCQQAAHKARLCWAAMIEATPTAPAQPCGDAEQADEAVSVDLIAKWARRMTLSLSDSECVALVQEILAARAKDRK